MRQIVLGVRRKEEKKGGREAKEKELLEEQGQTGSEHRAAENT